MPAPDAVNFLSPRPRRLCASGLASSTPSDPRRDRATALAARRRRPRCSARADGHATRRHPDGVPDGTTSRRHHWRPRPPGADRGTSSAPRRRAGDRHSDTATATGDCRPPATNTAGRRRHGHDRVALPAHRRIAPPPAARRRRWPRSTAGSAASSWPSWRCSAIALARATYLGAVQAPARCSRPPASQQITQRRDPRRRGARSPTATASSWRSQSRPTRSSPTPT